ncbi:MAG: transposase [Gallionella sp.]|nr:transposase [Gallionella sp.]
MHKFWHSRGYLPHCDTPGLLQAITFRLADSLPANVLERLLQGAGDNAEKHRRIENLLDAGHGACWLKQPDVADIAENSLLHWDGQRYRLLAWCVMPNHVHVLIEAWEGYSLPNIVQGWKSFTARLINRHLGRIGTLWMRDYFDRYIRDDHHLAAVVAYIHNNPVKAGLVQNECEWRHSSARLGTPTEGASASSPAFGKKADEDVGAPGNVASIK